MTAKYRLAKWGFYALLFPAVLGLCGWQGWTWWSWATAPIQSEQVRGNLKAVRVQIPLGTSAQQIGRDLEAAGLIRSAVAWDLWSRWLRWRGKISPEQQGEFQAGVYDLSPTQSLQSLASQIWDGNIVQRSYTIPEGWSLQQMADYFEAQGLFKGQEFLAAARQIPAQEYPWLPPNLPHLEGFLYPNTYKVPSTGVTPQLAIGQMLDEFERVALPLYQKVQGTTNLSLLEWVTLASIVEKEAVVPSERRLIAGVFTNRLNQGIALGADPTVEYGLKLRQTRDRPLTLAEVQMPSPYNTYLNPGLPPTPIASPGVASLEATLDPEPTDYLYFVARYDGTHIFSRTLAEHNQAIAQVEKNLANPPASKP